jgi:predicted aspartyl protease
MSQSSAGGRLIDENGKPVETQDAIALAADQSGLVLAGKDPDGFARLVRTGEDGTLLTQISGNSRTGFIPDPSSHDAGEKSNFSLDSSGQLNSRSQVLTDEGSFRDDFSGSSLFTNLTGTVTFTNGATAVTGSGTMFLDELTAIQHIKLTSHSDSVIARISKVISDTSLELTEPYQGASGSGTAHKTNWMKDTSDGNLTVSSSKTQIVSGTANGHVVVLSREGDYLPFILTATLNISQRVANQEIVIGFLDDPYTPEQQAAIVFKGTDTTKVYVRTSFTSDSSDIEEKVFTLPDGDTTNSQHIYQLDVTPTTVSISVNDHILGANTIHLPAPYQTMYVVAKIVNTGTTTATTLHLDTLHFNNVDQVQLTNAFNGNPSPVQIVESGTSVVESGIVFGVSPSTSAGVRASCRATTYTEQSSNAQRSVKSSSTNDTSAGTGAREIRITYFDSSGNGPYTTNVVLNGTTAVDTGATDICFIEKMEVVSVGSGGFNAGTISLYTTTAGGGSVIGSIGVGNAVTGTGDNKTLWAHHYVPNGKAAELSTVVFGATANAGGAAGNFYLMAKTIGSNEPEHLVTELDNVVQGNSFQRSLSSPVRIIGPSRITAYGVPTNNNTYLYGAFDYSEG